MATNGHSVPASHTHEFAEDRSAGPQAMTVEELSRLLNKLLEAERAGAKVLAAFVDDYERDTPAWRQLVAVQRDEATNCAILIDLNPTRERRRTEPRDWRFFR